MLMKKIEIKDLIATCSCSTDIVEEKSSAGLLSQFLNVIAHLQGPPHNMAKPKHKKTLKSGDELFNDHYNNGHNVIVERKSH